ncbi:MAG: TM0106 family RecB-like putative nuclease [Desulfobacteraceae bacterium]|nr:TM0106 family RecB-like putative nuclease [Desulfobacteraceae bacterium]
MKKHPTAYIYHYGHYEETALKHLMSEHGTREFQVDQLLRNHKLVDLYKVVKQGLKISESSYSLKKVENFYMEKRKAEVVSAVESVIFYEKWKLTQDPAILDSIRNYNEDDCRSTSLLHTWLLSIKPASAACFFEQPAESFEDIPPESAITEYEQELARMRDALADNLPQNREDWSPNDALFHLAGLLLDFYRRADKPAWFFADPGNDQRFDYLFVDEAGQVSLANMVAMAVSAKNIVLLGDQMQLGQPIQGRHPEDSGESVLDFLMDGYATVPENRGISCR